MSLSDCILWEHGRSEGYGITFRNGRVIRAHQLAWLDAGQEQPPGFDLHHVCGERLCVNVAHLELLSHADHARRHPKLGDACPKGHPYPESLRRTRRECAVCHRERERGRKKVPA